MPPKLVKGEDQLELSLTGHPDFPNALAACKAIPGRRYNGDRKVWCFPDDPSIAERLMVTVKPEVSPEVLSWVKATKAERAQELVTPVGDDAELLIPWANERMPWQPEFIDKEEKIPFTGLYPFQRASVNFMVDSKKCLNASDMGTGKTLMALSAVAEHQLRLLNGEQERDIQGLGREEQSASTGIYAQMEERERAETQGTEQTLPREEHRTHQSKGEKGRRQVDRETSTTDTRGKEQPMRGLRNMASPAVHGPGSCEGAETILHRNMEKHADISGGNKRTGYFGRDREMCSSLPELPSSASLLRGPILVICPNSVKGVWARECAKWYGKEYPCVVVGGTTPAKRKKQILEGIELNALVVINWEQIRTKKEKKKVRKKIVHPITGDFIKWREVEQEVEVMREPLLEETEWLCVIADEVHRAKNRKSLQAKGLFRLSADLMFGLSGTPLMNSPDEVWPVLHWMQKDVYSSYWRFFDQYVDFYEGQYGKIITGVKNPDALRFELRDKLVRFTKGQVLKDLPDKTREYVPVKLGSKQRKLYDEAEKQMWFEVEQAIKEGDKQAKAFADAAIRNQTYQVVNGAARTVRLRQIASSPALLGGEDDSAKLDAAVELILDAGKQMVVFTEFVATTNLLVERLRDKKLIAEAYTGSVSQEARTQLEDDFQQGDIDVIVGTIPAMKEGITLTAADTVLFIERHWTPAVNEQCEDRLHRVGQKKNVTVLILEAEDTVDTQKVSVTNAIKSLIVSSVIDKDDVEEIHREASNA